MGKKIGQEMTDGTFDFLIRADFEKCLGKNCRLCENNLPRFMSVFGGVSLLNKKDLSLANAAKNLCPAQCIIITKIKRE